MKNIEISSQIIKNDAIQEPHNKYIEIANDNRNEFNKRLAVNVKLEYYHDETKFELLSSPKNSRLHFLAKEFANDLNRLIELCQGRFEQSFISNEYIEKRKKEVSDLQREIRLPNHLKNEELTYIEKLEYLNLIHEFVTLRTNSYPKVVLNNENEIKNCIVEINKLCEELRKEFMIRE